MKHLSFRYALLLASIRYLLTTILFGACIVSYSQSDSTHHPAAGSIQGIVKDRQTVQSCYRCVVMVLQKDSTIICFTRTQKDGRFTLSNINEGNYQIIITYPQYASYVTDITIENGKLYNMGIISISPASDMLAPVTVTPGSTLPRMRGDTLEYNTSNIKMPENSTVEELIEILPGLSIDEKGVITLNGQKVERLLVDGEDFFGKSPTIATRNLHADMIAKIQILDKKSDKARFTGIDDGQRTKTINLILKDDKKHGYFGKVSAGGGDTKGFHNINGIYGAFKDRQQLAALAISANNGYAGFTGGDDGAGLSVNGIGTDALGASAGAGIPNATGAGTHYANTWHHDKEHVVSNYQFGHASTHPYSYTGIQQTLPSAIFRQTQDNRSFNQSDQHDMDMQLNGTLDSLSAWNATLRGGAISGKNQFSSISNSSFDNVQASNSIRTIQSDDQNSNIQGNIMWNLNSERHKGRSFSVVTGFNQQKNTTKGILYALNTLYPSAGTQPTIDTTNQWKSFETNHKEVSANLNFIQPLTPTISLSVTYTFLYGNNNSVNSTYGKTFDKYDLYIDSLSSHYTNNTSTHQASINIEKQGQTITHAIGVDYLINSYTQQDLLLGNTLRQQYKAMSPKLRSTAALSKNSRLVFEYHGNSQQPSIEQLNPIQNNNDPLHITLGNPNLHPSFTHSGKLELHSIRSFMIDLESNFSFTTNNISTKVVTDSVGKQISQAVNVGNSSNGNANFSLFKNIKNINLDLGYTASAGYSNSENYVNSQLSQNQSYSTSMRISIRRFVRDKYNFNINTQATYSHFKSSINPSQTTSFYSQNHDAQLSIFLLHGIKFQSNIIYTWRQKIDPSDHHNSSIFWNAHVDKSFMKKRLFLRWEITDILNRNIGISRTITNNQITENATNIIGRYWMILATFRFAGNKQ